MNFLPEPRSCSFPSQRLELYYVAWGGADKPVLILQHGSLDHARSWDWVARILARDWYVIAPDLRGHGDSAWSPDADYSMASYVADFAQLVDSVSQEPVSICAHSLGGMIATRYAGLYPHRVRRLANIEGLGASPEWLDIITAVPYAARLRTWIEQRQAMMNRPARSYSTMEAAAARMAEKNPQLSKIQVDHLARHAVRLADDGGWIWKFDPYLRIWQVLDFPQSEIEALWRAVDCPMLFFHGADSFMSNPCQDGRFSHFSNARLIEYENAGHWLHHDNFDRFITDLMAFL